MNSTRASKWRRPLAALALAALVAAPLTAAGESADAATPSGRAYYVDCSAKSAGSGSVTRPWRSLGAVNSRGRFDDGDRVLLKRGTTCAGRLSLTGSGSSSRRILLAAYGNGARPTINGRGTPSGTGAVQLTDAAYWTVKNLHITNTTRAKNPRTYRSGLLLMNTGSHRLAGMTVENLWVNRVSSNPGDGKFGPRDFGGISVLTTGQVGAGYDDLTIVGNTLDHVSRQGIAVSNHGWPKSYDRQVRITHNTIRWARGDSIMLLGTRGGRLDHNLSANGGKILPCPQCSDSSPSTASAGIWPTRSRNIRIDHNEVYGEHSVGGDGEGFDIDAKTSGIVLEYNYAHDNAGGGVLFCGSRGAVVRFNILENNAKSAIAFIGSIPARNSKIYNNTIYGSRKVNANVVRTFNGLHGRGISFKNNLVYSYGSGAYIWPTKKRTAVSNTLVGRHGVGRPIAKGTLRKDPGLRSPGTGTVGFTSLRGYKPRNPKTMQHGVAIPKTVTRDFFGKKINPKRPPRGAAG